MYQIKDGVVRLSVRSLVEFVLRSGDLDRRRSGGGYREQKAMLEGAKIHRMLQKKMGSEYQPEVTLCHEVTCEKYRIRLEGRADGIFPHEQGMMAIDEIKSMYGDISKLEEPIPVHQAQAMCYAYFYALQNQKEQMVVRMTYCNITTHSTRYFEQTYSFEELEEWFAEVITELMRWCDYLVEHREARNASIKKVSFPFVYRPGQKKLVVSAYRTMQQQKKIFMQAPTGTGKTMSSMFPAIQAMGQGIAEKIFYLTAKTITRKVAQETFDILLSKGLDAKAVTLTAKEKLCFLEKPECNPEACPYACGCFDRMNDAVYDLVTHKQQIYREDLLETAQKYQVCPFELALDVTEWVDTIICDYNYVFDPNVRLQRYFSEGTKGEYIFLIDEAHNLVERARTMYSADLKKEAFLAAKHIIEPVSPELAKKIERCNKDLLGMKRECESYCIYEDVSYLEIFVGNLHNLYVAFESFFEEHPGFQNEDFSQFYFDVRHFLMIYEVLDSSYTIYSELLEDGSFLLKLFCIHPANWLSRCMSQGVSSILFSATLLPMGYYKELLGGEETDYAMYVNSPFDPSRRLLGIASDVSSVYRRRTENEFQRMAAYLAQLLQAHKGNYLVFFPSYQFMDSVGAYLEDMVSPDTVLLYQQNNMTEQDREDFLEAFAADTKGTLVGMCVMGGIFSEGIDLTYEKLIGVAIVGAGLPQVCVERELLKEYFDRNGRRGFDFAYLYPSINKVLQAAGRLIRTEQDYGVIAMLDERFLRIEYMEQFPPEWSDYQVWNLHSMQRALTDYWMRMEQDLS